MLVQGIKKQCTEFRISKRTGSVDCAIIEVALWLRRWRQALIWSYLVGNQLMGHLLLLELTVHYERLVLLYLRSHYQHNHESVLLVGVQTDAQKTEVPTEQLLPVIYVEGGVPLVYLPSQSSSQQRNSRGSMKPQKVSSIKLPFHEVNQLTNQPTCRLATRFRAFFYQTALRKWHRLSAAWWSSKLHSRLGHYL